MTYYTEVQTRIYLKRNEYKPQTLYIQTKHMSTSPVYTAFGTDFDLSEQWVPLCLELHLAQNGTNKSMVWRVSSSL